MPEIQDFNLIKKLDKDLKEASKNLGRDEARFLVDAYYIIQEDRKRSANQERSLGASAEPHAIISWFTDNNKYLEKQISVSLDLYSGSKPEAIWARSQVGIGPIIAAGLLAHIDLAKTTTATKLWRYAGQDPTDKWGKGEKRPWNASLKVLCYKIGESFVKTCNHERSFYGPIYSARKLLEIERNDAGKFAEQAADILIKKKYNKDTEAYKAYIQGRLPPAHLHARARRYATKLFLSHYFEITERAHGKKPTTPWIIEHGGHADYIPPPGLAEFLADLKVEANISA